MYSDAGLAERALMSVQAVKPLIPKPTGGLMFWQGWRNAR
jgi:hypothetical protein